ncbi:succinylglutamate desuccinylase/aspartoacylase family protein [Marinobacter sp. X15-166B]|uniref:M14 family metallopeptidase n=1 Tax=Marinobacter sp. X15-166B TaxID=1897620 RepID=UPI00085C3C23|nr:succinylglutamate desuccinylase/aspartoacylase family protein [Marinobacter sp. X15-166B]OEY65883.1 succinylglutamate desuccinylase [Marinobacter sp. X15-166B]
MSIIHYSHRVLFVVIAGLSLSTALTTPVRADLPEETVSPDAPVDTDEDEEVADIENSVPRTNGTVPPVAPITQPTAAGNTDRPPAEPAKRIAPNIDLKEVTPEALTAEPLEAAAETDAEPDDAPVAPSPAASESPPQAATLTLLDTDVLPGTSTRLAWTPNIQIAGLAQPTPVLVVNGTRPGPNLCLTAAIHGDELNGIEIVRRTVYDLNPAKLSGRVIGVPIVNLQGFQQASRYLPDRRDLNRHFPGKPDGSLADRIAHSLFQRVIRHCDLLVDIHTGSLRRTNLPQLRADMNNPAVASFTKGFDRMAVVHSSGSRGMLRNAAVDAGITAVTMEAGESLRIQEHQINAGVNSLNSLMEKQGMISRMFVWGNPEPVYYDSHWVRAQHGGILFSEVKLGDTVSDGQILGYVADPITNAQHPIKATSKGRIIGMAVDQVVMAGFAAYHIGSKATSPEEG